MDSRTIANLCPMPFPMAIPSTRMRYAEYSARYGYVRAIHECRQLVLTYMSRLARLPSLVALQVNANELMNRVAVQCNLANEHRIILQCKAIQ